MGFEPITMLIRERGIKYGNKENLALLYEQDDNILEVFEIKEQLKKDYNVSLFLKPKNIKNFYDKIVEVASFVTSVKDAKEGKEIKSLN